MVALLGCVLSVNAFSAADCDGVPVAVKMGEFGGQEPYAIVRVNGYDYRLGLPSDDAMKMRFSLIQTDMLAGYKVRIRFWAADTCPQASADRLIPNSVQLVKS